MKKTTDGVEAYIAAAPKEVRGKLKELRSIIKSAAPKAEEKISYGIPYYGYHGRLAYFRYAKQHIGLYIPPPVIQEHKKELAGYKTAKATVQLPIDEPLPVWLIKKMVKVRAKINEKTKEA